MGFAIFCAMALCLILGFLCGKYIERSEWMRLIDEGKLKNTDEDK